MNLDERLAAACDDIPALVRCALVFGSEQLAIARVGSGRADDFAPLVRCAAWCAADDDDHLVEGTFVTREHYVVVHRLADARLLLVIETSRETNVALAAAAARHAAELLRDLDVDFA